MKGLIQLGIVLALTSGVIPAQTTSATLLGSVTDPSGGIIAGATVTVINEGTNDQRAVNADASGNFIFPSLLPGVYTVRVESPGFQRYEKKSNVLSANDRLSMGRVQLTVGAVTETVSVTAEGTQVQVASSESSSLLTSKQLSTIAQKGRALPNYLLLLPGVATTVGAVDAASGFLTLPNANGLSNQMITMSIDGLQGEDLGSQQLFTISISPDAVEEVKVLMNNYQAEYGRNGGATVNIVTKSGTKDFHGSVYYYKRHEMFNANTFFNNRSGLPKGQYRYNTRGVTIGGPVTIPGVFNKSRQKLFFFYNYDSAPSTSTSTSRAYLPTQGERSGDYSNSRQSNGNVIKVRDPLLSGTQYFPNNIVPASRINKQGQILLNIFTLPNALDRTVTQGAYNNEFQNTVPNVRPGHVFRVDYRPNTTDTFYFRGTVTKFQSVKSSLANWDFARNSFSALNKHAVIGWTRVLNASMVNEFTFGARRPQEQTRIDDDLAFRSTYNLKIGQFHPEINYDDLVPLVAFSGGGLPSSGTFGSFQSGRFPQQEADILLYIQDGFTITRAKHTFKVGVYAEKDRITTGSGFQTTPYGSFNFGVNSNFPDDSKHPFANALLGNFQTYQESQVRTRPAGVAINLDWYVQDSWKVRNNLTLELGLRTAYFTPWWGWHGTSTSFALERYQPGASPLLYLPRVVNGKNAAVNPLTGESTFYALAGAFVPGTGDPANGTLTSADPNYPRGFMANAGELLQPRFGFAWDVFGNGKTAVRGGASVQNQLLRYEPGAAGAPINYTPTYYYGNLDTYLSSQGTLFPGNVTGHEKDRPTPRVYNISFGVQQDIGFATVLDVKYVSTLGRNLSTSRNINLLPYGTKFLAENIDPTTKKPYSDNFLRPMPGWGNITMREAGGSSNYHSLQMTANRRFARGLTFGLSYTYGKAMGYSSIPIYQTADWNYGKQSFDQTHILTFNYTYEIPRVEQWQSTPLRHVFNNWEISGITSFSSGTPSNVTFSLTDGLDLYGGGDGGRIVVTGNPTISHGERGFSRMFDTSVFARPSGIGDLGNAGLGIVRGPGVNNWDVTLFKRFPVLSEQRVVEFRWEFYNLPNHTQFSGMNSAAQFNPAGQQTSTTFGQATSVRSARIMQASLRFKF